MRCAAVAAICLLAACVRTETAPEEPPPEARVFDVGELRFVDRELDDIARERAREARSRGIATAKGPSKVEALIALEGTLDAQPLALERFNTFAGQARWSADRGPWPALRSRARRRFTGKDDVSRRVQSLLDDWERQKLRVLTTDLDNRQWVWNYSEARWESEFHDFVRKRPLHAATWGWLVLRERAQDIQRQYGKSDAEHGYRFYLELSRLGTGEEARDLFSLPGIAIR